MAVRDELGNRMKEYYENIPIFKGEGRKYIDDLVFVGE